MVLITVIIRTGMMGTGSNIINVEKSDTTLGILKRLVKDEEIKRFYNCYFIMKKNNNMYSLEQRPVRITDKMPISLLASFDDKLFEYTLEYHYN